MGGNETMFGFNFVDGRIKGYPTHKTFDIKMVRGSDTFGINDFEDNGDGTVTDLASGLMWDQSGSTGGTKDQAGRSPALVTFSQIARRSMVSARARRSRGSSNGGRVTLTR